MQIDIVNTETTVFSGTATFIRVPGAAGELGILPGHQPLMTWLKPGTIVIQRSQGDETIEVSGGLMEVMPAGVTILADTAVRTTGLDKERAAQAARTASGHLREQLDDIHYAAARAELLEGIERHKR